MKKSITTLVSLLLLGSLSLSFSQIIILPQSPVGYYSGTNSGGDWMGFRVIENGSSRYVSEYSIRFNLYNGTNTYINDTTIDFSPDALISSNSFATGVGGDTTCVGCGIPVHNITGDFSLSGVEGYFGWSNNLTTSNPNFRRSASGQTWSAKYIGDSPDEIGPVGASAAATSSSSIQISCNTFAGAGNYYFYRSSSENGSYSYVGSNTSPSFTNTDLNPNTRYYYKIRAATIWGYTDSSSTVNATTFPASPSGLSVETQSESEIALSWTASSGASSYDIYRLNWSNSSYEILSNVSGTSYSDSDLAANTTYYYAVSAKNNSGASGLSYASATTIVSSPQNVEATSQSHNSAYLSWETVAGAGQYHVLRSSSNSGPFSEIGTTSSIFFTDYGLNANSLYYYQIEASNGNGKSTPSQTTEVLSLLEIPDNISATSESLTEIILTWDAVAGADEYEISQSLTEGSGYSVIDSSSGSPYTVSSLSPNTGYYFKLRALSSNNFSPQSPGISATTFPNSPGSLYATPQSSSEILLSWGSVNGTDSYHVYLSSSSEGPFNELDVVTDTSYSAGGLNGGSQYFFRVTAENNGGESPPSFQNAFTFSHPPENLAASVNNETSIDLSWDAATGATYYKIYQSESANGTYSYIGYSSSTSQTVMDLTPGTSYFYKLKSTNSSGDSPLSDSATATTYLPKSLTLEFPNSADSLFQDSSYDITWDVEGNIAFVHILLSVDNGVGWDTLATDVSAATPWEWVVPYYNSSNCLIKVVSSDGYTEDTSDENFFIFPNPSITILSPNGGESFQEGQSISISWVSEGIIDSVYIWSSDNSGADWTLVDSLSNAHNYPWTVPVGATSQARIKVSQKEGTVEDNSDGDFTISSGSVASSLSLNSPAGGENWKASSSQYIQWAYTGSIDTISLYFSQDEGSSWDPIATSIPNSGQYLWELPNTDCNQCRVYIRHKSDENVADTLGTDFNIYTVPNISVSLLSLSPSAILGLDAPSQSFNIHNNGTGTLNYSISVDSNWLSVDPASGSSTGETDIINVNYSTSALAAGSRIAYITITDASALNSPKKIQVNLNMTAFASLIMASPNTSQTWNPNSLKTISWNTSGSIAKVDLDYSLNAGADWISIVENLENTGSYKWTVPDSESDSVLIRVSNSANSSIQDVNDVYLSIKSIPVISSDKSSFLLETTQGENAPMQSLAIWNSGSGNLNYDISVDSAWITPGFMSGTSTGQKDTLSLSFATSALDSGDYKAELAISSGNADNSPLLIPIHIRVNALPQIKLTQPGALDSIWADSSYNISWESTPDIKKLRISLSLDGGTNWSVLSDSLPNSGKLSWQPPDTSSTKAFIKVESLDFPEAVDSNSAAFIIFPKHNTPPVLVIADSVYINQDSLRLQVQIVDAEGHSFTTELKNVPEWISIESDSVLLFVPDVYDTSFSFLVIARDVKGAVDSSRITVFVERTVGVKKDEFLSNKILGIQKKGNNAMWTLTLGLARNESLVVKLFNLKGKELFSSPVAGIKGVNKINLAVELSGMNIVWIHTRDKNLVKKFIFK